MKYLPYSGIVSLDGSKSVIQRYLFIASLHPLEFTLSPGSICDDVVEMSQAIAALGGRVTISLESISVNTKACNLYPSQSVQYRFKASATALRFWLARSLITKGKTIFHLSEQLKNRPLQVFLDSLVEMGCSIIQSNTNNEEYSSCIEISPPPSLTKITHADSKISSQFLSGLMMIAPMLKEGLSISFSETPVSFEYLMLTKDIMQSLAISSYISENQIIIAGDCTYLSKQKYQVEPELAGGAVLLALGAFSQKGIGINAVIRKRWHPDWEVLSILRNMGCHITMEQETLSISACQLHGITKDMDYYPDLVPLIAVLALFADGKTELTNISRLKYKESDRINGLTKAFDLLDVTYSVNNGSLTILSGVSINKPAILDTQNDHRLAMAFSILCLHYPQLTLSETESVKKSCPNYFTMLAQLKQDDNRNLL